MGSIKIRKERNRFYFYGNKGSYWLTNGDIYCKDCSCEVSPYYVYIIRCLKKAKLLELHYPLLCCLCYNKRKVKHVEDRNT